MRQLGHAFGDMVTKENQSERFFYKTSEPKHSSLGVTPLFLILIIFFSIILFRLFQLQIIEGKNYRLLSDKNRIKMIKLPALRGVIYDRKNQPLVRNIPIYRIKDKSGNFKVISREEALTLQAKDEDDKLFVQPTREYLLKEAAAHLIGYIGEVTDEEIKDKHCLGKPYEAGDFIGKIGLEAYYECQLKGKDGARIIEVDTNGKFLRELSRIEPISGSDLYLSIDSNLQKVAEKEMIGKKGAVVAQNPKTGEILALYSSPSFDPNIFTKDAKEKKNEIISLFNDPNQALIDRVISGTYPSGSTFKLVVSAAGLEDKKVDESTQIEDKGTLVIGQWKFPNWLFLKKGEVDGWINIIGAIKRSNDIFFYKLGEKIGVNRLDYWAKKFGLGQPLGIDLPSEVGGIIPNQEWKKETIGEDWYLGDTYHFAIGQGYLLVTPLQVNTWTTAIANKGKFYTPHLVTSRHPEELGDEGSYPKVKLIDLKLNSETIRIITEGMRQACATGGTGWPLFDFKVGKKIIPVACKTGTAEFGDPKDRTHAWFTAFAPINKPEIVATVLYEAGGEGSDVSAPIAKKIFEEWFKN